MAGENDDATLMIALEANLKRLDKNMKDAVAKVTAASLKMEGTAKASASKMDTYFGKATKNVGNQFVTLGRTMAATFGLLGASATFNRISSATSRLDDLADTANRLGTSAGEIVKWRSALEASGGSMDDFAGAADAFQAKVGAVLGNIGKTKVTKSALAAIGVTTADLANAKTLSERLILIADGIAKVDDRATRAAIADKLGLRPLLPLLEQGAAGAAALASKFDDVGKAADEGVGRVSELGDEVKLLQQELQIKSDNLFVRLGPHIANIYQMLIDLVDLLDNPLLRALFGGEVSPQDLAAESLKRGGLGGAGGLEAFGGPVMTPQQIAAQKAVGDAVEKLQEARRKLGPLKDGDTYDEFDQAALSAFKRAEKALALAQEAAAEADKVAAKAATAAIKPITPPLDPSIVDDLDDESAAVTRAKEAYIKATEARRNWRNDPEERGLSNQRMEDVADTVTADLQRGTTDPMYERAQAGATLREEFKGAIMGALNQLESGDFEGAALSFAGAFLDKFNEQMNEQIFDILWDQLGIGDLANSLFGGLDVASTAAATASVQTATAMGTLTAATYAAAAAMQVAAATSGTAGGGGWFGNLVSSVLGSLGGGGKATGGAVIAGQSYVVGEKRPEVFTPTVSGHIKPSVPNAAPPRAGGNVTFAPYIDARGADKSILPTLASRLDMMENRFAQAMATEGVRVRGHVGDGLRRRTMGRK